MARRLICLDCIRTVTLYLASWLLVSVGWAADPVVAIQQPQGSPVQTPRWSLVVNGPDKVVFRGAANFDESGIGAGSMLYPAPNLGGFIAAILTHATILEQAKNSQKEKLQESADKVLVPYRDVLNGFSKQDLMQLGMTRSQSGASMQIAGATQQASLSGSWVIESTPVFVMTKDEGAIILYNSVTVHAPAAGVGAVAAPVYQNHIRVVSQPRAIGMDAGFWIANEGERLKHESAALMGESLDIALAALVRDKASLTTPHKTFRYLEGDTEKIERAQMVSGRCDRVLIQTLRGSLISFPLPKPQTCAEPDLPPDRP